MTRVVAIVPMRHNSERVPGKNYRLLGTKPLFHHILDTLAEVPEITEIVVDTDSPAIIEDVERSFPAVKVLLRPEHLRDGSIAMNDVLLNSLESIEADVVIQTHSTNPFLSAELVGQTLRTFINDRDTYDSVFSVTRLQMRLWTHDTKPVNHDPAVLLRTQDLDPIYAENSCFYVFTPDLLRTRGNRVGVKPLMVEVPPDQAIDIDEESDFALAETIVALRGEAHG